MLQPCAPAQVQSEALQALQTENAELRKYLAAQKVVIASLERRVGRSLESLGVHLTDLTGAVEDSATWHQSLNSVQGEVDSLCDLIADTMLLQKLEAGKVEVHLEALTLQPLLISVSRHLLEPKDGSRARLVCKIDPNLPPVLTDHELTEAVLTDLLARSLKYSDSNSPVVLEAESTDEWVYLRVTGQRFAPVGNRDFATEIVLCCRRIEVQQGEVTCQHHPDGLQTVTVALRVAP